MQQSHCKTSLVPQVVKKFPTFYTILIFTTLFTRACHCHILSQINPVHVLPTGFFKIHCNIIFHLCLGLPRGLFPSSFPTKTLYVPLFCSICATSPVQLVLDLITWIIFCVEHISWSFFLCISFQSPVTLSLYISSSAIYSPTFSAYIFPSMRETKFHSHI